MIRAFCLVCLLVIAAACSSASREVSSTDTVDKTPSVETVEQRVVSPPDPCTAGATGRGCVYGIFVGMAQNSPPNTRLPYADEDARRLARALQDGHLMRPEDGVVLVNRRATERSVKRAFRQFASRIRPQDVFLFFFDGHSDTDTMALWDSSIEKQELGRMLRSIPAQQILLVLDMCYAGAFADLTRVQAPRQVVGWFSSRANEASYVPTEGQTGGYLADLFIRGIGDGVTTGRWVYARDMSRYVHAGYPRSDSRQSQHLVVDGMNMVLWRAPYRSRLDATPNP